MTCFLRKGKRKGGKKKRRSCEGKQNFAGKVYGQGDVRKRKREEMGGEEKGRKERKRISKNSNERI
jgi:hypothetical protein